MTAAAPRIDLDQLRRGVSLLALLPQDAKARRTGNDAWIACCSFHEDRTPSMRVAKTGNRWVYYCYGCGAKGDVIAYVMDTRRIRFLDAVRALTGEKLPPPRNARRLSTRGEKPRGKASEVQAAIVATYDYHDEAGVLLYQVVRLDPKSFRQRQPREFGGWRWDMQGVRRVPYRLPELLAAPGRTVFVVEGEKDVEALRATGRIATTNVGGAGKWRPEYSEHLRGRRIVVIPDNDAAGKAHARQVLKALDGIAESVTIRELAGLPPKGDVSDWLQRFGTRNQGETQPLSCATPGSTLTARAPDWTDPPRGSSGVQAAMPQGRGSSTEYLNRP